MTAEALIHADRLSKRHGGHALLDDVSLEVMRGELYALVGEPDCGAETLLRVLVGLAVPDTGSASIMGEPAGYAAYRVFARVGFLPADPVARGGMSVLRDVEVSLALVGLRDRTLARSALDRVGLGPLAEKPAHSLDDDQRRLLGIARAIAHSPEVLVLVEPTRGLGGVERRRVLELLRSLTVEREVTTLAATRPGDGVAELAARVGVMRHGRLVAQLGRDELHERGREHIEVVVSDAPRATLVLEERLGLTDFAVCQDNLIRIYVPGGRAGELNAALVAEGIQIDRLLPNAGSIEDLLATLSAEGAVDR